MGIVAAAFFSSLLAMIGHTLGPYRISDKLGVAVLVFGGAITRGLRTEV